MRSTDNTELTAIPDHALAHVSGGWNPRAALAQKVGNFLTTYRFEQHVNTHILEMGPIGSWVSSVSNAYHGMKDPASWMKNSDSAYWLKHRSPFNPGVPGWTKDRP